MLSLGQQIRRHVVRICALIREDGDLRRTSYRIYGDMAIDGLFCQSHVDIAGAGDLVDFWNALCPKGHGSDSLCTAGLKNHMNSCLLCRNQCGRRHAAVTAGRRAHDDFPNAGDLGRDHIHEYGRRIGRFTAGYIYTGPLEGRHTLPEYHAVVFRHEPALLLLLFMEFAYPFYSPANDAHQFFRHSLISFFNLPVRNADRSGIQAAVIKLFLKCEQGLITFQADPFQDGRYGFFLFRIAVRAAPQQFLLHAPESLFCEHLDLHMFYLLLGTVDKQPEQFWCLPAYAEV